MAQRNVFPDVGGIICKYSEQRSSGLMLNLHTSWKKILLKLKLRNKCNLEFDKLKRRFIYKIEFVPNVQDIT